MLGSATWGVPKFEMPREAEIVASLPAIVPYRLPEPPPCTVPGAAYIYSQIGMSGAMVSRNGVTMLAGSFVYDPPERGERWLRVPADKAPDQEHDWYVLMGWRQFKRYTRAKKLRRKGLV